MLSTERLLSFQNFPSCDWKSLIIVNLQLHIQGDLGGICNTLGNDSMCDSKEKVQMNMGPILNGYRDMVKRRYRPSCDQEQQLRNK